MILTPACDVDERGSQNIVLSLGWFFVPQKYGDAIYCNSFIFFLTSCCCGRCLHASLNPFHTLEAAVTSDRMRYASKSLIQFRLDQHLSP